MNKNNHEENKHWKHNKLHREYLILPIALLIIACFGSGTGTEASHHKDSSATTVAQTDTSKKSIPSATSKWIGNTTIKINYNSPGVRGRIIWGELVPYDAVWVTGAHNATSMEVGKSFLIGDKLIPAGKYALFTIPGKDQWTVIINKNWNQQPTDDY